MKDYIDNLPTAVDLTKLKPGMDRKAFWEKHLLQEAMKQQKLTESLKKLQVKLIIVFIKKNLIFLSKV